MLEIDQHAFRGKKPSSVRSLYDEHGGTLFGYIYEVVKDQLMAEDFLIKIFSDVARQFDEINWEEKSNWWQLHSFAKTKLTIFTDAVKSCQPDPDSGLVKLITGNNYLDQLSKDQKTIFCDIYYHRKTVAVMAIELNLTEDLIRKALKEAFAIMRKSSGN